MVGINQSGAAEAWWAHNTQVRGSKPRSDIPEIKLPNILPCLLRRPILDFATHREQESDRNEVVWSDRRILDINARIRHVL
ncbi:hypothetical protein Mp_4g07390 [Marchantia polymorpha subsp. ruderalis]|uniref:Uncharacterized protein n=2 Tax=Marchantia polymorpha TaxID=3197 RepID=A0AAF6B7E5_MARPO|nr:hypothetical protein MARPO_0115s0042 [Marchantia polymorpha]BBN07929.1 hypothetical protein Mp_4g07390 [Marchantia polymorpha subsp. ruderalis]|eukprot:PTQ31125.1 hypothetical protein MARPO_0115s0042 [Marchantia polymorpha]